MTDDRDDDRTSTTDANTVDVLPTASASRFIALEVSRQLLRELKPIVAMLRKHDRELTTQLVRAANSVHLNLGESRGRAGGDRRRCFEIAAGSAFEVEAARGRRHVGVDRRRARGAPHRPPRDRPRLGPAAHAVIVTRAATAPVAARCTRYFARGRLARQSSATSRSMSRWSTP